MPADDTKKAQQGSECSKTNDESRKEWTMIRRNNRTSHFVCWRKNVTEISCSAMGIVDDKAEKAVITEEGKLNPKVKPNGMK